MASTSSDPQTVIAPVLQGVWIHDPVDPEGTLAQFLYGGAVNSETAEVSSSALQFAGRTYPVYDFGDPQQASFAVVIVVPFDDDWYTGIEYLRNLTANRTTMCFRDSRSRKFFGVVSSVQFQDQMLGTQVSFTVTRNDYTEAV